MFSASAHNTGPLYISGRHGVFVETKATSKAGGKLDQLDQAWQWWGSRSLKHGTGTKYGKVT